MNNTFKQIEEEKTTNEDLYGNWNDSIQELLTSWFNLEMYCNYIQKKVIETRDEVRNTREKKWYIQENPSINKIKNMITDNIEDLDNLEIFNNYECNFTSSYNSDITFKSPFYLNKNKDEYFSKISGDMIEIIKNIKYNDTNLFYDINQKWIYINAKIDKKFFINELWNILDLWNRYWETDIWKWKDVVVEYSSPNAAKHLHAWHIRSTIIWHVIWNLFDKCWYTVHRINYLNDWGWIWYIIEWVKNYRDFVDNYENKNDLLYKVYTIYKSAGKIYNQKELFEKLNKEELDEFKNFFWDFNNFNEFRLKYEEYTEKSQKSFINLENWEKQTFNEWQKVINWSLQDFQKFYDLLWIKHEYLTWESIYSVLWKKVISKELKKGNVVFFDQNLANQEIEKINEKVSSWELDIKNAQKIKEEINSDVGAYVVMLDNFERYVVLKWNESTIYSTRDIAAVKHRVDTFSPEQIIYEVWQEQQEHFDKLFKTTKKLWYSKWTKTIHIFHWFYLDKKSNKKLSSREWASNVNNLLNNTIKYFYEKYNDNNEFTDEEKSNIAHTLWIWSVIFNDLKKDKKSWVQIDSNQKNMFKEFENSWWAYVIYTSCRAKSILRKLENGIPSVKSFSDDLYEDIEIEIIKKLIEFPDMIKLATKEYNPVKITDYLLKLSMLYNSYYTSHPVLQWNNLYRTCITKAVSQVLDNWLQILHINSLDKI